MKHRAIVLVFFLVLAVFQAPALPRLTPSDQARHYAGFTGTVLASWEGLAEIALWASGADDTLIAQSLSLLRSDVRELAESGDLPAGSGERGEYVLGFMHSRYLTRYSENQTRLDEVILSGRYNCVSSAVLYMLLASSAGLDVRGVVTKDHAFATVQTGGVAIDVETTNRYGFDPGNRKEFHDGFGQVTGFAYVPAKNYRDRAAISPLELVSLILSNRIVDLEKARRYEDAAVLAIDRDALLKGKTTAPEESLFPSPQREVVDRLLNYGASLLSGGREEEAFEWAARAGAAYPDPGRWEEFTYAALNNLVVKLLRKPDIAAAEDAYRRVSPRLNTADAGKINAQIVEARLVPLVNKVQTAEDFQAVLSALEAAAETLSAARIREFRTAAEHNRLTVLHNAFATLYNRRDYDGARKAVEAALAELPGNRQLITDLNQAERALSAVR